MSAESAMDARLEADEGESGAGAGAPGRSEDGAVQVRTESRGMVGTARFGSTRLLRELLAADACASADGADRPGLARRLLGVVSRGLDAPLAAFVDGETQACVAAGDLAEAVRAVLEGRVSGGGGSGVPLARRSMEERRAFLLRRPSRDPLMVVLRDACPAIAAVALVPLWDGDVAVGVLVLGARGEEALGEPVLASLTAAFRLLGVLLSAGRGRRCEAAAGAGAAESEGYAVEVEELEASLAEANDALRQARERASSELAALRADLEAERARAADLEARLAAERGARERGEGLDAECRRLAAELAAKAAETRTVQGRLAELEQEACRLRDRVRELEREAPASGATEDAAAFRPMPPPDEAEHELELRGDGELEAIAARAAAALDAGSEGPAGLEESGEEEDVRDEDPERLAEEAGPEESREEDGVTPPNPGRAGARLDAVERRLVLLDSSGELRELARELAAASGRRLAEASEAELEGGEVVLANLFDPAAAAGSALLRPAPGRVLHLYCWDAEAELGVDLGPISCLPRPLDPTEALSELRAVAGKRLGGVLLVSARLRDLAGLRAALAEIDAAGSVAYDGRQALDLLEIVRQPDALLVDLALPAGQGLALVETLRRQPATAELPIALLLPERLDPAALRVEAERAGILARFGIEELRKTVGVALARSR